MAKSHKSATLPPNFLVQAQPVGHPEENEGFFSKLKKRFKLKKGKYNVDISTGECENVSAVSFKKRESAEVLAQDESPLKYEIGRSSERVTRSASPKTSKPASRTSSDRVAAHNKNKKSLRHPGTHAEGPNSTIAKLAELYRGNEYSFMKFDKDDPVLNRPVNLVTKADVDDHENDSAIDLDGTDVDAHLIRPSTASDDSPDNNPISPDPGYERLPLTHAQHINDNEKDTDSIFDPNYESVKDVKDKFKQNKVRLSKSIDSLDDPNYQSINDVKSKKEELFGGNGQKPKKTYSMFESIESLDEPGYESLNDVKKKMMEHHLSQSRSSADDQKLIEEDKGEAQAGEIEEKICDDSAVELAEMNDSLNMTTNEGGNISNKSNTGLEDATNTSTALTDSSRSKDSGFESRTEKSPDHENPEDLYSKVRKRSEEPEQTTTSKTETKTAGKPDIKTTPATEEIDSDVELSLEPGYAECADAIKGFVPGLSIYSDGSGSKMSSCNSLDLSAEDFVTEPGYAECADAIKTGVIKKISVSNERLVDAVKLKRHSVDEATLRKGGGEIYANPQILFRKRSKLLDDRNSGEFTGSSESLMSNSSIKSKEPDLKIEQAPILEAPPLPARNYSLYLDNEEAEKIVPAADTTDPSNPENLDIDDAFEEANEPETDQVNEDVDVSAILQIEQELKEELRNEPALKTPDDVDEVTRAIESKFPDTVKVNDPFSELMDYDEDEVCKSDEFLVEIPDIEGGKKFLTIKEKHESVHIQEKRKSVKKQNSDKASETNDISQKCENSENVDKCDSCEKQTKENTEIDNDERLSESQSTLTKADSKIENSIFESVHVKEEIEKSAGSSCDSESCRPIDLAIPAVVSDSMNCESAQSFRTQLKDKLNISRDILTQNNTSESTETSSVLSSVNVDRLSLQESPLRMISLSSMDSDDDIETTEALPKLEIVEKDWESAFDTSDSQIDTTSKDCKSPSEISEEVNEGTETSVETCAKSNELFDEIDGSLPQNTDCDNEKTESVTAKDLAATLDTRLCVIEPNASMYLAVDNETVNANVVDKDEDVSESNDESLSVESVTRSAEGERSPLVGVVATSSRLSELSSYNEMIPHLYEDTEPTHMSLNEILTLSGSDVSAFRFASETDPSSKVSKSRSTNSGPSHIPSSSPSRGPPPPRPPSYSSHHSSKVTPTDEIPPPYRIAANDIEEDRLVANETEGASEDGSTPPAIPPRAKIRKQPRPGSASQDFMESMRQLKDCGWYWGPLSWEEAEQKLANKPEGTFLVRDSSDERYILSLSFKNQGRVHHTRIEHHKGHFSFWSQPDSHGKSTIKEFIEQCVNNSRNGRFLYFIRPSGPGSPPMPIHLLHPVSRFVQMQSLQHSCRFCILQLVRRDHIDMLPVPTRIKQYLKEAQYYVEYLDD